jgi:GH24 family phage-related lysozyme (muramidase)
MSTYDGTALRAELTRDEGRRNRIYKDTVGKTSGGVGRNLDDVGLMDDEIDLMLTNDIGRAERFLDANLPWWRQLDDVRQRVLMNMAFNMAGRLLGFHMMLAAAKAGDYETAANEMANSIWAKQVGDRAERLEQMMRTGGV